MKVAYTHKGFFGLCPVYFAHIDRVGPSVEPRHWTLHPLLGLSATFFDAVNFVRTLINPHYDGGYTLRITGELDPPKIIDEGA